MKSLLLVNKPLDWTSNDVVQFIKHFFHFRKVGHAGTLDPKATGLLILGVNEGTKALNSLLKHDKIYEVKIQFHQTSASFDLDNEVIQSFSTEKYLTSLEVQTALKYFLNLPVYNQIPPVFSAIKIHGKKAYELARKNQVVNLIAKSVSICAINQVMFDEKKQILSLSMHVSSGFYIRAFVRDLAQYLNVHGLLIFLNRTQIGNYSLSSAIDMLKLKNNTGWTEEEKNQFLEQKLV